MTDTSSHLVVPDLDDKGLRHFGVVTGAAFAVVFGVAAPWLFSRPYPYWPWIVAAVLTVLGVSAPRRLWPVYYWWTKAALLIGRITTPIILAIVFYAVITPAGFLMRWRGRDPMHRRRDDGAATYRVPTANSDPQTFRRPF